MSALESRIPSRMLSSVEWMARGDLNGNYCNTANHASIYKSGLRALRTQISPLETKVRMLPSFHSNLIPITSPPQQSFQAYRYSFPLPLWEMQRGRKKGAGMPARTSHITLTLFFGTECGQLAKGMGMLPSYLVRPHCLAASLATRKKEKKTKTARGKKEMKKKGVKQRTLGKGRSKGKFVSLNSFISLQSQICCKLAEGVAQLCS